MKNNNIQAKKSTTNSCYNVDAIPGNIKKITVVQTGTARAIKIYGGTSSKPTTEITAPSTELTMEFDFTGKNYTYFSMTTPANAVYINTITIEYEASSTPVDATWSVDPASVSVRATKTAEATITTNYNGTLSVSSTDSNVAIATIDGKVITVTGVAEGTTSLTITGSATSKYNAISKAINVTVTPDVVTPGAYDIVPNNTFFNCDAFTTKPSGFTTATGEKDDITITYNAAASAYINTTQCRAYSGTKLDFKVPTGFNITAIAFTADGNNWAGTHTASVGTMTDNKNWAGNATEVTITFGGTCRITKIRVTYALAPTTATITLNSACTDGDFVYGTYSNSSAFVVPEDLIVSVIVVDGETLTMFNFDEGDVVPANTGVLVSAIEGGNYVVNLSDATGVDPLEGVYENALRPTGAGITAEAMAASDTGKEYFRLTMHNDTECGFWWGAADGAAFALGANKAYLVADPASTSARGFSFGDNSEALESIEMNAATTIYTLNGVKVNELQKGLNIVNGKKVMVK